MCRVYYFSAVPYLLCLVEICSPAELYPVCTTRSCRCCSCNDCYSFSWCALHCSRFSAMVTVQWEPRWGKLLIWSLVYISLYVHQILHHYACSLSIIYSLHMMPNFWWPPGQYSWAASNVYHKICYWIDDWTDPRVDIVIQQSQQKNWYIHASTDCCLKSFWKIWKEIGLRKYCYV